ncbi:MAG: tripartite tricarboxylate transporter substrate binding protein [Usitatibacter sp.]
MKVLRWMAASFAAFALSFAGAAMAQAYPNKPIKMIVPYPPGGPTDVQARVIAIKLGELLGQPVIIENRGGAGGMLGSKFVAQAEADGYTLLMGASGPQALGPLMAKEPLYDPIKDFTPISLVSYSPLMLVVSPKLQVKNVKELIELAKQSPGKLNYGSFGNGTMAHLAAEQFNTMAGVKMTHIPYKGSAPAMVALLGGEIEVMFDTVITALPQVKAGKINALAVTKSVRSEAAPDLPTVAEAALPGYEAVSWIGVMGPPGMPQHVVDRLSKDMVATLADPSVRERLKQAGAEPVGSDAATFGAQMKSELGRWEPVVKAAGLLRSQ